jgi:DNA-directed RNA polymerase specialized sigma24 family protein
MEDSSELVASVRAGDLNAFGVLYDKYGRLVRAICYDRLHNRADAEDLAQEVFVPLEELYQAIARLPQREQLAIHIHYLTEQPASCAQEILKLSSSGFYKLLDRARKNLASKMASEEGIK